MPIIWIMCYIFSSLKTKVIIWTLTVSESRSWPTSVQTSAALRGSGWRLPFVSFAAKQNSRKIRQTGEEISRETGEYHWFLTWATYNIFSLICKTPPSPPRPTRGLSIQGERLVSAYWKGRGNIWTTLRSSYRKHNHPAVLIVPTVFLEKYKILFAKA